MARVTINDSSEAELFTASNPGQVSVASGAASKVDANIQVGDVDVGAGNPVPTDPIDDATRDLGKVDIAGIDAVGAVAGQKAKAASIPVTLASDEDILSRLGEVQASPTANTLLARLKDLLTGIVLAAGSNAIGKLAANDGVDIGDVTVNNAAGSGAYVQPGTAATWTVAGGAIVGPGHPTIDSYTHASVSLSANTANQQIVAAPGASKQIWVYGVTILADTGAGTIAFQDEDDTAITGAMALSDEGGFSAGVSGNFAMPIWKLATNKALEADTVTLSAAGWIDYAIVSV